MESRSIQFDGSSQPPRKGADPLVRFVTAQAPVYASVLAELGAGRKQSHWMWFIFPQLAALGRSPTAKFYGLADLDEARDYLRHPVLGPRLLECTRLVNARDGSTLNQIFGTPDDLKFRSCATLFHHAAPKEAVFTEALQKYCGSEDERTVQALEEE
jgi:uncharacterized protein (DUF1810 family)